MNLQPSFENDLVKMRPLLASDFDDLYAAANDPKIWEQHPCKRNQRDEFEKFFKESMESKGALVILNQQSNKIIGSTRYCSIKNFKNGIEIGWTFLSREYWGGTYNKDIKNLMINHAFNYVDYVVLFIDKDNLRSQEAAKKIGAVLVDSNHTHEISNKSDKHLRFIITKKPTLKV